MDISNNLIKNIMNNVLSDMNISDISKDINTNYTNDNIFHLPIEFTNNKRLINDEIKKDLELNSREKSLYSLIFNCNNEVSKLNINNWSKYYTTNKNFLKDTQKIIKSKTIENIYIDNDVLDIWSDINTETSFKEKYNYIEFTNFNFINLNSHFLQMLSLYDICSPIMSLTIPIIILILPFFILKLRGHNINITNYINVLKNVFKHHTIGKLFSLNSQDISKNIYIFISIIIFAIQNYNNVKSCIKFFNNLYLMHNYISTINNYIYDTVNSMNLFERNCIDLKSYKPFIDEMNNYKEILSTMNQNFSKITSYKLSFKKSLELGYIKKLFFKLYNDFHYKSALSYSFYFNGYIDNMKNIQERFKNGDVNKCSFSNKTQFKNSYFPFLINKNPVKNSYNLNKNMLLTGPNAAGKTTLLKTTLFNIIFSQQLGIGFYKSAKIKLYDYIHCYINIPDTSDRDSLFQAEARRCKNILDKIKKSNKNHFCIFDELFSGTNPYEAISSATAFLDYINNYNNVDFMITTHYLDICKKLENNDNIINLHMQVKDDFKYTYKLKYGISNIKGGLKILRDLKFPKNIINNSENILKLFNF
jgi:DNA mismatch repair ATPase MutS